MGKINCFLLYISLGVCVNLISLPASSLEASERLNDKYIFDKGRDLINENRFSEAIEILTPLAQEGFKEANYWVGFSYRYISLPLGSPKDELRWYKKGAESGDPYSMLALGTREYILCSVLNECSIKDHYWKWKANKLLRNRSRNEDTQADYFILRMLDDNSHDSAGKEDLHEFIYNLKEIAMKGDDMAAVEYFLKSESLDDENERFNILKDIAKGGGARSAALLGEQYYYLAERGIMPLENYERSIRWLKKAADVGLRKPIYILGGMYEGQKELIKYIDELYFYCRVTHENGAVREWCGPSPHEKYGKVVTVPISNDKRKIIDHQAREWFKNNIISRNYTYFSSYNP